MQPAKTGVGLVWIIVLTSPGMVFGQGGDFLGRPASDWVRQLTVSDVGKRRGAAFALGRMGSDAEIYLPRLLAQALKDANPTVRETAAMAVGDVLLAVRGRGVGPGEGGGERSWSEVGPALLNRIDDEKNAGARRGLVYALGCFGPAAGKAVPTLRKALTDDSPAVRQNAAWALGRIGLAGGEGAVSDLCYLLQDAEPLVRRDAATALGDIGVPTAAAAVKPMLDLIDRESKKTGDPVVFKTALEKLIKLMSERDQEQAKRLYPYLAADDPEIARAAALALANMGGPNSRPALPVLRAALRDEDPEVQEQAAAGLGVMKKEAVPAIPDLAKALDAPRPEVRRKVVVALSRIADGVHIASREHSGDMDLRATQLEWLKNTEAVVPKLARILKGEGETDLDVRRYAAEALFFFGTPANEKGIPSVVEVIRKDPILQLRHICIEVLQNVKDIRQNLAEDTLREVLDTKEEALRTHRWAAARVLANHLKEATPDRAGELLLEMLKSDNLYLYQGAESRVGDTGENRGNTGVKENSGGDARFLAAMALGWMGKAANKLAIIDELTKAKQQDGDERLKKEAAKALDRIRGKTPGER